MNDNFLNGTDGGEGVFVSVDEGGAHHKIAQFFNFLKDISIRDSYLPLLTFILQFILVL
jgi:hypothetical protein